MSKPDAKTDMLGWSIWMAGESLSRRRVGVQANIHPDALVALVNAAKKVHALENYRA